MPISYTAVYRKVDVRYLELYLVMSSEFVSEHQDAIEDIASSDEFVFVDGDQPVFDPLVEVCE